MERTIMNNEEKLASSPEILIVLHMSSNNADHPGHLPGPISTFDTENSKFFVIIIFSQIALKDILVM